MEIKDINSIRIRTDDPMPPGGVKELQKSKSGLEYLRKLQKKHHLELIQPDDPKFEQVYGEKLRRDAERKRQSEQKAKEEWERSEWLKNNPTKG